MRVEDIESNKIFEKQKKSIFDYFVSIWNLQGGALVTLSLEPPSLGSIIIT